MAALLLRPRESPQSAAPPPTQGLSPPAVTPEMLAAEVEQVRGLKFVKPPRFHRLSESKLAEKVRASMQALVPPAEGALRVRAALALGLIRQGQEFDTADCLAGALLEVPAAWYDSATATMWLNDAFSPETRPDLTARLVFHLALALLRQHPDMIPPLPEGNDDALLSAIAVREADATLTAQRHARLHAGRAAAGVAVPETSAYYASPPFLRAVLAFPATMASTFHEELRKMSPGMDGNQLLNRILAQPPRTTAELLHPELWPLQSKRTASVDRTRFPKLNPLTENSLGEFGIRTLLKTQLTSTEAEAAAAGLAADRYFLFEGSGPGQDHLLWCTEWTGDSDAGEFLRALAAAQLGNSGAAPSPDHFPAPGRFEASLPSRHLFAITGPRRTVTFTASPDAGIARQLIDSQQESGGP